MLLGRGQELLLKRRHLCRACVKEEEEGGGTGVVRHGGRFGTVSSEWRRGGPAIDGVVQDRLSCHLVRIKDGLCLYISIFISTIWRNGAHSLGQGKMTGMATPRGMRVLVVVGSITDIYQFISIDISFGAFQLNLAPIHDRLLYPKHQELLEMQAAFIDLVFPRKGIVLQSLKRDGLCTHPFNMSP